MRTQAMLHGLGVTRWRVQFEILHAGNISYTHSDPPVITQCKHVHQTQFQATILFLEKVDYLQNTTFQPVNKIFCDTGMWKTLYARHCPWYYPPHFHLAAVHESSSP